MVERYAGCQRIASRAVCIACILVAVGVIDFPLPLLVTAVMVAQRCRVTGNSEIDKCIPSYVQPMHPTLGGKK